MLRPLSNLLLIKRDAQKKQTEGGLYLPENTQKKPHRGVVRAAGPGRWDETRHAFVEVECEVGDQVIFPDGMGTEVEIDGETLLLLSEDLVLAIVLPEAV